MNGDPFASKIKAARLRLGITQVELKRRIEEITGRKASQSELSQWESGSALPIRTRLPGLLVALELEGDRRQETIDIWLQAPSASGSR